MDRAPRRVGMKVLKRSGCLRRRSDSFTPLEHHRPSSFGRKRSSSQPIGNNFNQRLLRTGCKIIKQRDLMLADHALWRWCIAPPVPYLRFVGVQNVVLAEHVDLYEPRAGDLAATTMMSIGPG